MNMKTAAYLAIISFAISTSPALAERTALPGSADGRVKTLTYHENDVYKLVSHYGYSTAIEFSPSEQIETISIGDSQSWQVIKPSRPNILFIKPLEQDARTNMTVITSRRFYSFELSAHDASSSRADALTYRLKFRYGDDTDYALAHIGSTQDNGFIAPAGPVSGWNFDYDYAGARALRPKRVFDDGRFTYFQFAENAVTPAIFAVDENGDESLINFSHQGAYLVVNEVGKQFTLRDGKKATCIINNAFKYESGTQRSAVAIEEDMQQVQIAGAVPVPARKPSPENEQGHEDSSLISWLGTHGAQVSSASLNQ